MQVERKFEIENFEFLLCVPYLSMHGIIWFHELPCMKSYDSMRGIAWKVCRSVSMHGIVWNHTDHMRPCMELHGSPMSLDPGRNSVWEKQDLFKGFKFEVECVRKCKILTRVSRYFASGLYRFIYLKKQDRA